MRFMPTYLTIVFSSLLLRLLSILYITLCAFIECYYKKKDAMSILLKPIICLGWGILIFLSSMSNK